MDDSIHAPRAETALHDALWRHSAGELAALIRAGDVSSREVVDAHLARIEEVNGSINALTVVLTESARQAADAADSRQRRSAARTLPPLHGVPITVKENIDCIGSPTTVGVAAGAEALPPLDAPVVERLRAAGAIPIGRSNMPEMGMQVSTNNPFRGLTRNPWNAALTAGGSSGGEAAAIASGMSPLGLGNDIGGSLRNPAHCCGIASLKPTQGRVPLGSGFGDPFPAMQLMMTNGPMARSVADLRLALELIHGQHPRDPRSVSVALDGAPATRRVALVTELPGRTLDPAIVAGVRASGAVLAAAGYEVVETTPPEIETVNHVWRHLLVADLVEMAEGFRAVMSPPAIEHLDGLIRNTGPLMPNVRVHEERSRLGRAWASFFADHPLIVGPVWPAAPFAHDADVASPDGSELTLDMLRFITPGNLLGIPGAVVPTAPAGNAPITVQVYADRFRDDLVLTAAETIERAFGPCTPVDPFVR